MIKTAIIGASGFIGRHLWARYRQVFPDCIGTALSNCGAGMTPLDLRQPDLAALRLQETGHQAVIIAAARSNIADCERDPRAAHEVNVAGVLKLGRQIGRTSLQVIFLSSDYIFAGIEGSYDDGAAPAPTTEYGRQKVRVERELPALVDNCLILRLSKVYGLQKHDGTLLDEMACSLAAGREVQAAIDQHFCPTYVGDVVNAIETVQPLGLRGVMNVCSNECWRRYDLARALAREMGADPQLVKRFSLADIPALAERPRDTTMRCTRLGKAAKFEFTPLQDAICRVAENWRA